MTAPMSALVCAPSILKGEEEGDGEEIKGSVDFTASSKAHNFPFWDCVSLSFRVCILQLPQLHNTHQAVVGFCCVGVIVF